MDNVTYRNTIYVCWTIRFRIGSAGEFLWARTRKPRLHNKTLLHSVSHSFSIRFGFIMYDILKKISTEFPFICVAITVNFLVRHSLRTNQIWFLKSIHVSVSRDNTSN